MLRKPIRMLSAIVRETRFAQFHAFFRIPSREPGAEKTRRASSSVRQFIGQLHENLFQVLDIGRLDDMVVKSRFQRSSLRVGVSEPR